MAATRAVVWLRRDLRLHDHPALTAALAAHDAVAVLYVLDDRLLTGRWRSPNRAWFLVESLRMLDARLRDLGGCLYVRRGNPVEVVPAFAAEAHSRGVYVSRDYSPFGRRRDAAVERALAASGTAFAAYPGNLAVEPDAIAGRGGAPLRVYRAYKRRWDAVPPREVLPPPGEIRGVRGLDAGVLPPPGLVRPTATLPPEPGELAARGQLAAWSSGGGLRTYATDRDCPALDATSHLSAALRWGLLSAAEVLATCAGPGEGRARFREEVAWRDFFAAIAWHYPHVLRGPMQPQYAAIPWNPDADALAAWKAGQTGYPFIDAAMRELVETGYMHNRARMAVASFLAKDLLVDWREGERFFMEHLFDGDPASNNGGWQWAASTGADAQPYLRVFNPVLQGRRFDPEGEYVRRWLPELAGVEPRYLHEPWTMPLPAQVAASCVIGRDYPAPIVDHAVARERAIAAYRAASGRCG